MNKLGYAARHPGRAKHMNSRCLLIDSNKYWSAAQRGPYRRDIIDIGVCSSYSPANAWHSPSSCNDRLESDIHIGTSIPGFAFLPFSCYSMLRRMDFLNHGYRPLYRAAVSSNVSWRLPELDQ